MTNAEEAIDSLGAADLVAAVHALAAERGLDEALPAGRITLAVGTIARRLWPDEAAPLTSVGSPLYQRLVRRIQALCAETEALTYVHND